MDQRRIGWLCLIVLAGLITAEPANAQENAPDVSVRLVSQREALPAGGEGRLGLVFDIEPGWHLYWKNNGDTGMPIFPQWRLPRGIEAGELRWPAPRRYIHAGMVDYIYEDQVTLILPVRINDEAAGRKLTFAADIQWLVCKEACLPGDARVEITLPVMAADDPPRATSSARFFEQAERRLPKPWRPGDGSGVHAQWRGRTLSIRAQGADEVIFYPLAPRDAAPIDPASSGRAAGQSLRIEYDDRLDDADRLSGVLEAQRGDETTFHFIELRRSRNDARGGRADRSG